MTPRARALLAVAAGATLALGAPPLEFWPSTLLAAALLAAAVDGATVGRAALSGWLMGTCATLGAFYWIVGTVTRFTALPFAAAMLAYVLMAALAGVALALAGALSRLSAPLLGQPVALALGLLVAERYAPAVFPWQLASPLIVAPWLPQAADVVGVSGLGALLVGTGTVFARAAARRASRAGDGAAPAVPRWHLALAAGLTALAWGYGAVATARTRAAMARAPALRVALVQPAIPPTVRADERDPHAILAHLQRLTDAALAARPDLVVWSEGAYPFVLPHRAGIDGEAAPPVYFGSAPPIVVGALTRDEAGEVYNSALLRLPDGGLSRPVAKQVLVPFGEYIPVVGEIAWVRRTFARAQGIRHGRGPALLAAPGALDLGVLNCFEDTMPAQGARVAGADLLVNVTNDAWFGDGAGPWQHLMLARWRAIETRRELVRAVNTGVSCHVDALGRVARHAPMSAPTVLATEPRRLALRPAAPVVVRWAPPLAAAVLGGAALAGRVRRRRQERTVAGRG